MGVRLFAELPACLLLLLLIKDDQVNSEKSVGIFYRLIYEDVVMVYGVLYLVRV
jgi:hypothetical protein